MENIGRILLSKNHSNNFFDPLRVMEIETKISKWNLIKLKSICTPKEILKKKKMRRQLTGWEKMFANDLTDKGLISKIYK